MNNDEPDLREIFDFLRELPDTALDAPYSHVKRLMHYAAVCRQWADREVSGPQLSDYEKRLWKIDRETVVALAAHLGCKAVEFNYDPRGHAVFVKLPSGRTNDVEDRGWAVPEVYL